MVHDPKWTLMGIDSDVYTRLTTQTWEHHTWLGLEAHLITEGKNAIRYIIARIVEEEAYYSLFPKFALSGGHVTNLF